MLRHFAYVACEQASKWGIERKGKSASRARYGGMVRRGMENFRVGKAPWPGNAMEECAAIKNKVNLSCRLVCLLILGSSPDRSEESNNAGG